jgi:hypothetical protein
VVAEGGIQPQGAEEAEELRLTVAGVVELGLEIATMMAVAVAAEQLADSTDNMRGSSGNLHMQRRDQNRNTAHTERCNLQD